MKRLLPLAMVLSIALVLLAVKQHADAIGGAAARPQGGKAAAPQKAAAKQKAAAPHPAVAKSPSISPGNVSRPAAKAAQPKLQPSPQPKLQPSPQPKIQSPQIAKGNLNLPGNTQRPTQLPKQDRPPVQIAKGSNTLKPGGGKINLPDTKGMGGLPDIKGKGGLPDIKNKGGLPDVKGKGGLPDIGKGGVKDSIKDLQKKNPGGAFDFPKKGDSGFPGAGKLPDTKRPGKDDISNGIGLPNAKGKGSGILPDNKRPDGGKYPDPKRPDSGKLPDFKRPDNKFPNVKRPDGDRIRNDFVNNWKNATNIGNKTNIGDKTNIFKGGNQIGNINVDMSNNANFVGLQQHANVVNNNLRPVQNGWFNNQWWGQHPINNAPWWHYNNYGSAGSWWRPATWGALTGWMTAAAWQPPMYYDYGSSGNVQILQDVVYVNDQPVASAPVYAQQAINLAYADPPPREARIEWLPMGTWALSSKRDDDNPNAIFQLALSKEGLVSGTWYSRSTDKSAEIEGGCDPETQRIAFHQPNQPDIVVEVGVYNLSQDATPCLIHFGTLETQTWYLVRLQGEGDGK